MSPNSILRTLLESEDSCVHEDNSADYDFELHIAAIFIVLGVSTFGALVPVLGLKYKHFRFSPAVLNCLQAFGTGVILATAFIHMLPPSLEYLTNPCLPGDFTEYASFAGAFAMIAIFIVQLVEFMATSQFEKKHPGHTPRTVPSPIPADGFSDPSIISSVNTSSSLEDGLNGVVPPTAVSPSSSVHSCASHISFESDEKAVMSLRDQTVTIMLELGVAFHSVIIGVTLGLVSGEEFPTLLVAISFHQFFEGLGLGASIAQAGFSSFRKVVGMALFYAVTTPLGVAIGVGVTSTYNTTSYETSLITQGVFDSVSAGILIYMALVELMTHHFTNSKEFRHASKKFQTACFASMYLGACAMSIIGMWA